MGSHIVSHCHCAIRSHVRALTAEQFFFVEQSAFNQRNKKTSKDMTKVKGKRKLLSTPRWKWRDYGPFFLSVCDSVCALVFFSEKRRKRIRGALDNRQLLRSLIGRISTRTRRSCLNSASASSSWAFLAFIIFYCYDTICLALLLLLFHLSACLNLNIRVFACEKKKTSKQTNSKFIRLSTQKSTLLSCNIT